jgi:hypothetical protein
MEKLLYVRRATSEGVRLAKYVPRGEIGLISGPLSTALTEQTIRTSTNHRLVLLPGFQKGRDIKAS